MDTKLHLLSANKGMQKSALNLGRQFFSGLAGPGKKLLGGAQILKGKAQQAAATIAGLNRPAQAVVNSPMYQSGMQSVLKGKDLREAGSLSKVYEAGVPFAERVGRVAGTVAYGAPIALAPFSAAKYMGAANVDPKQVENYARYVAAEQGKGRVEQLYGLSPEQRQEVFQQPGEYLQNVEAPQAVDLYQGAKTKGLEGPSALRGLSGLWTIPFVTPSADRVIREKTRSEMLNRLPEEVKSQVPQIYKDAIKSSSMRKLAAGWAKGLFKGIADAARTGYTTGRQGVTSALTEQSTRSMGRQLGRNVVENVASAAGKNVKEIADYAQQFKQRPVYSTVTAPWSAAKAVVTKAPALTALATPHFLNEAYRAGADSVFQQAGQDSQALADLIFANKLREMQGKPLNKAMDYVPAQSIKDLIDYKVLPQQQSNAK